MFTAAATQHAGSNRIINSLDDFLQQMVRLWDTARNALLLSQHNQKYAYDLRHRHEEFFIGDYVFLSTQRNYDYGKIHYASKTDSPKFEPRYLGPFRIIGKPSKHAYELELPPSIKIHPVIHIRYLLRPRQAKAFPDRIADYRQPPTIIDNVPEYEVDSILSKRIRKYGRGSRVEYLIHWAGYPSEEDTWEPISNLTHCLDLINSFNQAQIAVNIIDVHCMFVTS
jgi:hypothetical protein